MSKLLEQIKQRYGSFELSHDKNVLIIQNIEEFILKIMLKLLEFIEDEGYIKYKDGRWYKRGSYRPWKLTTYYKDEELLDYFINNYYDSKRTESI